jgi:hypothetical protein
MRTAPLIALLFFCAVVQASDARYCRDAPLRDERGRILRDHAVLREFQRIHPCPATGRVTGACPGWAIDHVIPLAVGGCDSVVNLQWLPWRLKGSRCGKDRFERQIYARPFKLPPAVDEECEL